MKKGVFIAILFLLIIPAMLIPSDIVSGKHVTLQQETNVFPAQDAEVQKLLDSIMEELDRARKLTDDNEIKDILDGIKKRVRELEKYESAGEEDMALKFKYVIAEQLELLINKLPSASVVTTATAAAAPTENPLYEELINIRAKIERLIKLEEGEEGVPPERPTLTRVPDVERAIVYPVKVVCGPSFGKEGVQKGSYSTAVNIHNPSYDTVVFYVKAVVAKRPDEARGKISEFRKIELGPDEAVEIDCLDISALLGLSTEATEANLTAITPVSSLVQFVKGFVVIHTPALLDVVGVYTASTPVGFSMDVEYISPSISVTRPVTTEEPECPVNCKCLSEAQAKEYGYVFCNGERTRCGYDDNQNPLYWYQVQESKCPVGCSCLSELKAKEMGYTLCNGERTQCGTDDSGAAMYCFEPQETKCPTDCRCLTEAEAKEYGYTLCNGERTRCGTNENGIAMYCFEPQEVKCPTGCLCMTEVQAKERGYTLCNGQRTQCGTDASGVALYCFEPQQVQCPTGCQCMTEVQAKRYGYTLCNGQRIQCGTDASGVALYCFQKPVEQASVARITVSPTQARNPVGTQHTLTIVVYDSNGKPVPSKTLKIVHSGANSIGPLYYVTGANGSYTYTYKGQYSGTEKIVVTADGVSATAYKDWYFQPGMTTQ